MRRSCRLSAPASPPSSDSSELGHGGRSFAKSGMAEQGAFLTTIETSPFFQTTRQLTAVGLVASPRYGENQQGGLADPRFQRPACSRRPRPLRQGLRGLRPLPRHRCGQGGRMSAKYKTSQTVDFVVVGSGAAGGVIGARAVACRPTTRGGAGTGPPPGAGRLRARRTQVPAAQRASPTTPDANPQSFRRDPSQKAQSAPRDASGLVYARVVGGSSNHYTANYWRFHEIDFQERSAAGRPSPARASPTGPSPTRSSSPTTRRWNGTSACPALAGASPVRSAAHRSPTPCRPCR